MKTFLVLVFCLLAIAHEFTEEEKEEIKKSAKVVFDKVDTDHNGNLDETEVENSIRQLGKDNNDERTDEKIKELAGKLFKAEDGDGDGNITFDEFYNFVLKRGEQANE